MCSPFGSFCVTVYYAKFKVGAKLLNSTYFISLPQRHVWSRGFQTVHLGVKADILLLNYRDNWIKARNANV